MFLQATSKLVAYNNQQSEVHVMGTIDYDGAGWLNSCNIHRNEENINVYDTCVSIAFPWKVDTSSAAAYTCIHNYEQ